MQFRTATEADVGLLAVFNRQLIQDEGHRNRMSLAELIDLPVSNTVVQTGSTPGGWLWPRLEAPLCIRAVWLVASLQGDSGSWHLYQARRGGGG